MSRTRFAIKNTAFGILSRLIGLGLSFASRTVFIYFLGTTYLGINGLYTEILSVLSFAELGFGTALNFAMYAPVANNDESQIIKLLRFYKKVYNIIAVIVATVGLCILPFLDVVVKGADSISTVELYLYYLIFLFNSVISYLVTYKYSYVNALQKSYIVTNVDMIVNFITIVIQIMVICLTKNFFCYLITHSLCLLGSRIFISIYLNKKFHIFNDNRKLELNSVEKTKIYKDVKGLAISQFSSIAIHSTDNILISSLTEMGVVAVGLISNYILIITNVLSFVTIMLKSVAPGFGNLVASSSIEHYRKTFLKLNFLTNWIYGFCSIAFYILIPPFITLWIGKENLISNSIFLIIVIDYFYQGTSIIYGHARTAKGRFDIDKWVGLIQALTNLVISIICAQKMGLIGIYVGTIISRIIYLILKPVKTYKYLFEKSSREYFIKLLYYSVATAIAGGVTYLIVYKILVVVTIKTFIYTALIVAVVPNVVFIIMYCKLDEFCEWYKILENVIRKRV